MPRVVDENYQTKVKKPDDFDEFWQGVRRQADGIPLNPEIIRDPLRSSDEIDVFQIFYASLDNVRIASWYCRPAERSGRLPAILSLPGYQSDPPIPTEWARKGYAALSVAPRCTASVRARLLPTAV